MSPRTKKMVVPTLAFESIGAIAWAIRGTNGWGAIDGTVVPAGYGITAAGAAVRAVSIWPSKIAILYSVFLCIAAWSFIRLHHHVDTIDPI